MAINAITPQEFLINDKLAVTARKLSFMLEPTRGTKLLMANLVVFNEILSAL